MNFALANCERVSCEGGWGVNYSAMLRAKFLGDAIPATSFAAGANCLDGWGDSRNVNFSGCIAGNWPRSNNEWRHSDITMTCLLALARI